MHRRLEYPSWHDKSLWLSSVEIENPMDVLDDFCYEYPLREVRLLLWEWLCDALSNVETDARSTITLFEHIVKAIEAVHLINSERNNQKQ